MNNTKTYSKVKNDSNDIKYIIKYSEKSKAYFRLTYSSISGGYEGLMIDSYIETLRGFLRSYPSFIEECDMDIEYWLEKNGFEEIEPTETEKKLWSDSVSSR